MKKFSMRSLIQKYFDEMKTVKYEFPYLNVRVDYCGDPVINAEEPKKSGLFFPTRPNR